MAIKLTLTAALLVAMVAFATAATYTTIVTTTIDEDETNPRPQQCQREIQGRQFRSCQRYLSGGRRNGYDDEEVIEMTTENSGQQGQKQLRECCEQLRNVNEQCRCEAIRHAVRQQQQGPQHGGQQGQQVQQVYERAQNLPRECRFRQPQQCQIRTIFV